MIDLPVDRVDSILNYCVELGLLVRDADQRIGCPKMLYRVNNDMVRNPQIKEMIRQAEKFRPQLRSDNVGATPTKKTYQDNQEDLPALGDLKEGSVEKDLDLEINLLEERLKVVKDPSGALAKTLREKLEFYYEQKSRGQRQVG